ncbi:hypothetical protein PHMEG_00041863 [Phytophthora megakarya]|uniref:Uncharacterized protein n=1 Tax=Phytophthora megakarya TaxID=4795 RepID=A0A225UAT4_9STRA|nr:hypothetical protein PHMEG_00041863 [Phytophthora megakarya]
MIGIFRGRATSVLPLSLPHGSEADSPQRLLEPHAACVTGAPRLRGSHGRRANSRDRIHAELRTRLRPKRLWWLDWIVKNNLPLYVCENLATRRYSNLDPICVETLLSAMDRLTRAIERTIAAEMPDQFGLIFDGWSHASEHFVAVFAC